MTSDHHLFAHLWLRLKNIAGRKTHDASIRHRPNPRKKAKRPRKTIAFLEMP